MKKAAKNSNKSLKTFYLYTFLVLILIVISLGIKAFYIIQQSKFDSIHDFTLAVTERRNVKEVIVFHTQIPSLTILSLQDNTISYDTLAKNYGIYTDGYIQVTDRLPVTADVSGFLWTSLLHPSSWESNLTVFDKVRLLLLAKSVTPNNKTIDKISLLDQNPSINTLIASALMDQDIATENISIQIINATDTTGLGQRLGRVLTNMGANVVDVSSSQVLQNTSTITYFGNDSYTAERLQKILRVTATPFTKQSIANIIVTIGKDKKDTITF